MPLTVIVRLAFTHEPDPKFVLFATVLPLAICQLMLVLVKVPPEVLKVTEDDEPPVNTTVEIPLPDEVKVPPGRLKLPPTLKVGVPDELPRLKVPVETTKFPSTADRWATPCRLRRPKCLR